MNDQDEPVGPLDRRRFLQAGLAGGAGLVLAPSLLTSRAAAADLAFRQDGAAAGPILVVIQLSGGNDGLSTVVPFADDLYHKMRPALRLTRQRCLPLHEQLGLHGNLKGLHALHADGKVAILRAAGYPRPNRSHFESMDIWHSADPTPSLKRTGWLARAVDQLVSEQPSDAAATINLAEKTPLALAGGRVTPISFQNPNAFQFSGSQAQREAFRKITSSLTAEELASDATPPSEALATLTRAAEAARRSSERIRAAATSYKPPLEYPRSNLGNSLKTVAALVGAGLSTRVYYTYLGGFDTHNEQGGRHDRLMTELDVALTTFQKDLGRLRQDKNVVTLVFSEFGRRVAENASRGTDHGTAGPVFVVGAGVKGGIHGPEPVLSDLVQGDLRHTVDFRAIYASILRDHMRVEPESVLGAPFGGLTLFAG